MLIDGFLVIVTKLSSFLDVLRRDHANGYRLRRDSCQLQVCINTTEALDHPSNKTSISHGNMLKLCLTTLL